MANQEESVTITMGAKIITNPSKLIVNENSKAESHLFSAEITDGPLEGKVVTAKRTVKSFFNNPEGEEKENCAKGDKVTLHYSTFEGKDGKRYPSFQISLAVVTEDDDNLLSIMDKLEVSQVGE